MLPCPQTRRTKVPRRTSPCGRPITASCHRPLRSIAPCCGMEWVMSCQSRAWVQRILRARLRFGRPTLIRHPVHTVPAADPAVWCRAPSQHRGPQQAPRAAGPLPAAAGAPMPPTRQRSRNPFSYPRSRYRVWTAALPQPLFWCGPAHSCIHAASAASRRSISSLSETLCRFLSNDQSVRSIPPNQKVPPPTCRPISHLHAQHRSQMLAGPSSPSTLAGQKRVKPGMWLVGFDSHRSVVHSTPTHSVQNPRRAAGAGPAGVCADHHLRRGEDQRRAR